MPELARITNLKELYVGKKDVKTKDSTFSIKTVLNIDTLAWVLKGYLGKGEFHPHIEENIITYYAKSSSGSTENIQFEVKEIGKGIYDINLISDTAKNSISPSKLELFVH